MGAYDRSSKWLIQHHGDSLLRLAGIRGIETWRPLQSEVVQPAQLPDGLLEARVAGAAEAGLYVVEIGTYAEERLQRQIYRDTLLVLLDRDEVPEVVAVVLRPRGKIQVPTDISLLSREGGTEVQVRWRLVELWKVPVEDLLATGAPGLMPWAPLCRSEAPPEQVLRRCREVIDREPREDERLNLLAVTQVLSRLRYNDPGLLAILGGSRIMIESPLLDELKEEWTAQVRVEVAAQTRLETSVQMLLAILTERFGELEEEVEERLRSIRNPERLEALVGTALRSETLDAFQAQLPSAEPAGA